MFRFRHLRLRANTSEGAYGCDLPFGSGLTVVWADNTKGKSTCLQGMLYALGLERMLSPRREVPLPHAMTSYLETDEKRRLNIIESWVSLEIANTSGDIITVHRPVKSKLDARLVRVDFGPSLTQPGYVGRQRDFFVNDPGAAQREDGFHYFLETFLGWKLPLVRRYDAPEAKLYLETVFPLFWVEQKTGWSSIPAAIPTYLRIRDVQKRAFEFIADLDVHKNEVRRQSLEDIISENVREWKRQYDEICRLAEREGGKVERLPNKPTSVIEDLEKSFISFEQDGGTVSLLDRVSDLRSHVAAISQVAIPNVDSIASATASDLARLEADIDNINSRRIELHNIRQIKDADIKSIRRRISHLEEDLRKNLDVMKLERFSGAKARLHPSSCPTCGQEIEDTLLPQYAVTSVMPVEENVEYIRSQIKMFQSVLAREEASVAIIDVERRHRDKELSDAQFEVRIAKSDLLSPRGNPSAAVILDRVRSESTIKDLEKLDADFNDCIGRFAKLAQTYGDVLISLSELPENKMSRKDQDKIDLLTRLIRKQAEDYGFSTFAPDEISISEDSYRPQKEGFEIGFETSASDAIRLKWAYQLGLLELGKHRITNHPGVLVLDEPRQQSSSKVSFERLLQKSSDSGAQGSQIIFATSEDLQSMLRILSTLPCQKIIFRGYVLQKIVQ